MNRKGMTGTILIILIPAAALLVVLLLAGKAKPPIGKT